MVLSVFLAPRNALAGNGNQLKEISDEESISAALRS